MQSRAESDRLDVADRAVLLVHAELAHVGHHPLEKFQEAESVSCRVRQPRWKTSGSEAAAPSE